LLVTNEYNLQIFISILAHFSRATKFSTITQDARGNNNNNNNKRICIAQVCRMTSEALGGQLQSCYTARARPKCGRFLADLHAPTIVSRATKFGMVDLLWPVDGFYGLSPPPPK